MFRWNVGELLREYIHDDGDERGPVLGRGTSTAFTSLQDPTSRGHRLPGHVARLRRHHAPSLAIL